MTMTIVAFFAAVAILCCAADDSVTTSLLLPSLVFTDQSVPEPTFVGQVTATSSATYYTLNYYFRGANASLIHDGDGYTFSENPAGTQYVVSK